MRFGIGSAPGAASFSEYITHTLPQGDLAAERKKPGEQSRIGELRLQACDVIIRAADRRNLVD
jgi:hypothetical protein